MYTKGMKRLLLALLLASPALAQEQAVVPITKLTFAGPIVRGDFGSGFCLDSECRYIVTNYHVAKAMGKHFSIQHEPVLQQWLDSSDSLHDLAVVELARSLDKKGFHGLPFNTNDELAADQDIDIYSYPLELNPKRKLMHFHGKYVGVNNNGLLVFSYEPSDGKDVKGGASGGVVLDSKGKVVAVLSDIALNEKHVALGVPVSVLSAFVGKNIPYLSAQLFPKGVFVAPVEADVYPEWVPETQTVLTQRPVEPEDIKRLRTKAQDAVNQIFNFIAVQSYEWGKDSGTNDPLAFAQYEIKMVKGTQHFRDYPDGTKERDDIRTPGMNHSINPGDAWSSTALVVGWDYKLKIHRAPDIERQGQSLHVYQYIGKVEDNICSFDTQSDLGFVVLHNVKQLECFGEVWTDKDENILRISQNLKMVGGWANYHDIVTYDWVEIDGERKMVPATVSSQAERGGHTYWCRGVFTNYQEFKVKTQFILTSDSQKQ